MTGYHADGEVAALAGHETATSTGGPPSPSTIQGRTFSHDGVARLLARLQVVPDLTNVQLVSSTYVEGRRAERRRVLDRG